MDFQVPEPFPAAHELASLGAKDHPVRPDAIAYPDEPRLRLRSLSDQMVRTELFEAPAAAG